MPQLTLGPQTVKKINTLSPIVAGKKKLSIKERRAKLPKVLQIITSPRITSAAAGIATLATTGNPLLAFGAYFATGTALGIVEASPKAEEFLGEKLKDPTAGGEVLGEAIEDPKGFYEGHKKEILLALGLTTAGGAAYLAGKDILTLTPEEIEAEIGKAAKKLSKKRLKEIEEQLALPSGYLPEAPAGPLGSGPMQPIPPATEEITTEKKKSKSRRRSRAQFPSQIISQNVKVMVENKTNKFIKRAVYV